jgi:2-dehydropantoate 2-reductase
MKFAMLGAGGLGGYFGARLAQAGHDVAFIARGAHLAAMRAGGLRIVSENGDAHIAPVVATDDPKTLGPVDCVIVAVKLWDLEAAATSAKPLIGAHTAVVSFQNGIEKDDVLARIVGAEHVVGGVGYIAAKIAEPGVIEQTGRVARAVIGELDGTETERVTAIVQALTAAGIDTQASNTIKKATWEKFVFIVGLSGLTSLIRAPIGPIRENAEARSLLADAMHEVVNLGIASGIDLDPGLADAQVRFCDTIPAQTRASMAVDLERGRRLELPWLSGAVARLGPQFDVDTPVNDVITRALAIYASGAAAAPGPS